MTARFSPSAPPVPDPTREGSHQNAAVIYETSVVA